MAQNAQNHVSVHVFEVGIFNTNIWPLFTPKCQILAQNRQFDDDK